MPASPCKNCRQVPEIIKTDDPEYPFVLRHKAKDLCYPKFKLESHQKTKKECVDEWNKFNK